VVEVLDFFGTDTPTFPSSLLNITLEFPFRDRVLFIVGVLPQLAHKFPCVKGSVVVFHTDGAGTGKGNASNFGRR
jgi:hypothetical protein